MKIGRACATTVAALALGLGVAACGEEVVEQSEVQDEVSRLVEQQAGEKPKSVECPEHLTAEKAEKMNCTVDAGGQKLNVEVTVTSVEGDQANFNVEVVE